MYQYDHFDQAIVDARVAEFRDQVKRRLAGEITEDEFKPLRLMNGLYLQLHAYMLRVAIPYGTLSSPQLRMLAHIATKYDRGYAHFTTRQNLQYNWMQLHETPDLMADLASVEMHAIQTSGNCIRNISSDQFAGAAADEVADPRPYAELLRQWSSFHPEFSFLPRKFKIAVTASDTDRAAIQLHDIGLQLVHKDGVLGFRVLVGGGPGELVRRDIADAIAAGLEGMHLDRRQFGQQIGRLLQLDPVVLDVLARGEMRVIAVVFARNVRQHPQLRPRQRAVRNGDAQHIGVQLQIQAIHQPQRLEGVLGDFIVQAACDLIAKFGDAGVDDGLVIVVVAIHQMASTERLPRARSARTEGPEARTRSRVVLGVQSPGCPSASISTGSLMRSSAMNRASSAGPSSPMAAASAMRGDQALPVHQTTSPVSRMLPVRILVML